MKHIFKILSLGLTITTLIACSSTTPTDNDVDKTSKEYTSAFICPMHCAGSGSETEGKCPVCGMDYTKNEEHKHEVPKTEETIDTTGKEYTSAFICSMHCAGSGSETEGKCPVCGMDYVKNETHNHKGDDHSGHKH